jgi:5-methyltetrahydrofolate--homocysteine methyltransferase
VAALSKRQAQKAPTVAALSKCQAPEAPQKNISTSPAPETNEFQPTCLKAHTKIEKTHWGHLPHWYQKNGTYAITFRLADSLPQSVLHKYQTAKKDLLRLKDQATAEKNPAFIKDCDIRLQELYQEHIQTALDEGHGVAWMKHPEIAEIIANALQHFAGERYELGAWCVMPNHVHMILKPLGDHTLSDILHSIKRHSALVANKHLGRYGAFWQKESYDHLIRDEEDFWNQTSYIQRNPAAAKLKEGQYLSSTSEGARRLESAATDFIGGFVIGIHGADEFALELEQQNDPYTAIMVKAVADRFAEAFAELLHHRARVEWGYERPNEFNHNELIKELYRGIRPAPGYPAQPDHTEKPILFSLLDATNACGVTLTESCAMHPASAVSGLYLSHPESHYFAISDLQKDQVADYATRKGMPLAEAEKWLGPWLGYAE